jgi:hypothetical protein
MLKDLGIPVLLFALLPAPKPVPRQASTSSGQTAGDTQKQSQSDQSAPRQPPPPASRNAGEGPGKPPTTQGDGGKVAPEDKEQKVELTKLPPVVITKDAKGALDHIYDWGPWVFNLLLVAVGFLQVFYLGRTLGQIRTQAGHMEDQTPILRDSVAAAQQSAEAAETSAKAAMGVAVPTLVIQKFWIGPRGAADVAATLQAPKVDIVLKNYGQSPAFLKSYSVMVTCDKLSDLPTHPYYSPTYFNGVCVVEPNTAYPVGDNVSLTRPITDADISDLLDKTKYLTIYGVFSYGNIFDSSVKDLRFCKRLSDFGKGGVWAPFILDEKSLPRYIN